MSIFKKLKLWRLLGLFVNTRFGGWGADLIRGGVNALLAIPTRKSSDEKPWTPFDKKLSEARVAVVTTAGFYLEGQEPFDVDHPRGDATFRAFSPDVDSSKIKVAHVHYTHSRLKKDLNVVLPLDRLKELVDLGVLGGITPNVYNFGFGGGLTGAYIKPEKGTAHDLAKKLIEDKADFVLMVPA